MLTTAERYYLLKLLAKVSHNSITGLAIQKFNEFAASKHNTELNQLVLDLQSQIDDNPRAMKEILVAAFEGVDGWRRQPQNLNLDDNVKLLIQKAMLRFPTRHEQAAALGLSQRQLYNKLNNYGF